MRPREKPLAVLTTIRSTGEMAWWWPYIDHESLPATFEYHPIVVPGGRPRRLLSRAFVSMCAEVLGLLRRLRRRRCEYVFTFECDWVGFLIAITQTALRQRRPRHVILQFIMREKDASLASRAKYAFMRWCFSSVYLCVCSARREADYYQRTFGWPAAKLGFVPLHSSPEYLARPVVPHQRYVIAAGRTFRDYATLIEAFAGVDLPLTIVASPSNIPARDIPPNVTILFDRPLSELIDLIASSMIVVVPLQEREISIGQTVVLEAMSMGKAVVVTAVNGTIDYIEHMETGVLVPPRDPEALRRAVLLLAGDDALRQRMGAAARQRISTHFLPSHYAAQVAELLCGTGAHARPAVASRPIS
jgi:glycosyltransferase involved in cell wall biosynthesis